MQDEIICKSCGNTFQGRFCNKCGEKVYTNHDKTFAHFAEEGFHFLTHFDSKFLRSWWLIMTKPGFVSKQITDGVRKPYYKPLNLFLIGVILYLLFPFFEGLNMRMQFHVNGSYQVVSRYMVKKKMETKNLTFEQLSEKFDHKSPKFAKILLLIIIPLSGLTLQWLFYKHHRYYFDHVTLASELNTFYLYFTFLILPLIFQVVFLIFRTLRSDEYTYIFDLIAVPLYILTFGVYCSNAFRRFYGEKKKWTIFKSVLFLLAHSLIVYVIYKFILFSLVLLFI
ncbi:MAG: DUF3667 domain-containing protein [Chitinophagaceae bacterium]